MKKKIKIFINESSFGSSTSAEIFFNKNKVVDVLDTSTNKTNYQWDGWGTFLEDVIGLSMKDFKQACKELFEDFEDEYRQPYVCIHE